MAAFRIVLGDGREEEVHSYRIDGERILLARLGGAEGEVSRSEVDFAATFAANVGVEFEKPAGPEVGDPVLELVSSAEQEQGDYRVVEGLIRNVSSEDLKSVVARVIGEEEDGGFITSEESLVDWSPLRAGTESPFRVVLKSGGRVKRTRLGFRGLLGEEIATRGL